MVVSWWRRYVSVNILSSFKVLLLSAIVVAVFSVGLKSIELTTDPVELWSAPNSQARLEKQFHDTHFDPFFRTNQLILTAPGRQGHIYDSLYGPQNFSGIISKDLIIELLELQTRIQVKCPESKLTVDSVCKSLSYDLIWHIDASSMPFLEHWVLVRGSAAHSESEGCVFRTAEPIQPLPDGLCSQQLATVLPEQSEEHYHYEECDKAGRDQRGGLERPLNLLPQVSFIKWNFKSNWKKKTVIHLQFFWNLNITSPSLVPSLLKQPPVLQRHHRFKYELHGWLRSSGLLLSGCGRLWGWVTFSTTLKAPVR